MPPTFDPWQAYAVAAEVSMATQASTESLTALRAQRAAGRFFAAPAFLRLNGRAPRRCE